VSIIQAGPEPLEAVDPSFAAWRAGARLCRGAGGVKWARWWAALRRQPPPEVRATLKRLAALGPGGWAALEEAAASGAPCGVSPLALAARLAEEGAPELEAFAAAAPRRGRRPRTPALDGGNASGGDDHDAD
jgi:hypothetical protein